MAKKTKRNALIGLGGSALLVPLPLLATMSCSASGGSNKPNNGDNFDNLNDPVVEAFDNIRNNIVINDVWKNKPATTFLSELTKSPDQVDFLVKNTKNFSDFKAILESKGIQVVVDSKSIKIGKFLNSVDFTLLYSSVSSSSKPLITKSTQHTLVGFQNNDLFMKSVLDAAEKEISFSLNNLKIRDQLNFSYDKATGGITAEDVIEWSKIPSNQVENSNYIMLKFSKLFGDSRDGDKFTNSGFVKIPTSMCSIGNATYKLANKSFVNEVVKIEWPGFNQNISHDDFAFENEEKRNEFISWNASENDNGKKGDSLTIKFKLVYEIKGEDDVVISRYEKPVTKTINGWSSYQSKFETLTSWFDRDTWRTKDNNVLTSLDFIAQFNKNTTQQTKNNFLKETVDLSNAKITFSDDQQDMFYRDELQIVVNKAIQSTSNTNKVLLEIVIKWKNLVLGNLNVKATKTKEVLNFKSSDDYFNTLKDKLANLQLTPTQKALKLSSREVYEKYQENNNSLSEYVNGLPVDVPPSTKYTIQSVTWNEGAPIEDLSGGNNARGAILNVSIRLTYGDPNTNALTYERTLQVVGFKSIYQLCQEKFDEIIRSITFSLKPESRNLINKQITNENIRNHVNGIPEVGVLPDFHGKFEIKNMYLDYSKGNGTKDNPAAKLGISFNYVWTIPEDNITLNKVVSKEIGDFVTWSQRSLENYTYILSKNITGQGSYMEGIVKKGESKSNWLSSYFGYDLLTAANNNYNAESFKEGLKRLWDMPFDENDPFNNRNFGVRFEIKDFKYSETDPEKRLSNTQIRITYKVTNVYPTTSGESVSFERTEVIGGFYDPFDQKANDASGWKENHTLNDRSISKYSKTPTEWRTNIYGTWQTTWAAWGFTAEYDWYMKKNWQFLNYASKFANSALWQNDKVRTSITETRQLYEGEIRYGNKDSDGTLLAPLGFKIKIETIARDKRNNFATGKYKTIYTTWLKAYLYFKNGYWK